MPNLRIIVIGGTSGRGYFRPSQPVLPLGPTCASPRHKFAANYLAFIQLASIRLWLRANESTPLNENSWQLGRSVVLARSALRLGPPDTQEFRHPHQVGERARGHFPHDMPAMDLDGNLAQPQFAGDLLVHQAGSDEAHHLAFALGQAVEACAHVR